MFDFSFSEFALLAVAALLLVDPKDVPGIVRTCGKWFRELRSVTEDVRGNMRNLLAEADLTTIKDEIEDDLREAAKAPRYIEDEQGNLQRVYDISDLEAADRKADKPT